MAAKRSKRTRLSSARVSDGVGPRCHLALVRCAERARLVVVLRGRSAATHVAAIRKRPRRHEWVAFLTKSFVFIVSEVRAPVMGTDARKTLDQFSNRANASRSSRKVSN